MPLSVLTQWHVKADPWISVHSAERLSANEDEGLIVGQWAARDMSGARSNEPIWLAVSRTDEGFANVPLLDTRNVSRLT
ncbi:MAG: hypothetical protein D8M59_07770 [Planctomycetes bacterium]|nr:hypothetical protein [Planctomycetota bacterium]